MSVNIDVIKNKLYCRYLSKQLIILRKMNRLKKYSVITKIHVIIELIQVLVCVHLYSKPKSTFYQKNTSIITVFGKTFILELNREDILLKICYFILTYI